MTAPHGFYLHQGRGENERNELLPGQKNPCHVRKKTQISSTSAAASEIALTTDLPRKQNILWQRKGVICAPGRVVLSHTVHAKQKN